MLTYSPRDILGIAALSEVTEELSNLADAIQDVTYRRIRDALSARHGEPRLPGGEISGFSVISLGKLGGKIFRIGHLGDLNEPMLLGALTAVEMALRMNNIPHARGGVDAAMDFLASA